MDWSEFAGTSTVKPEQAAREQRTRQELQAYALVFSRLLDAFADLRRHGRELTIDEGGRHIFVTHKLRTIGIHRDNSQHRFRVSGPGRFDPRSFHIPDTEEALAGFSVDVVKATLEMLLAA